MDTTETLVKFFEWCIILNIGFYFLTIIALFMFRGIVLRINARLFGVSEVDIARESFSYVGRYKLAIIMFFFVPYLALRLMF